jgi:hypothetical protein
VAQFIIHELIILRRQANGHLEIMGASYMTKIPAANHHHRYSCEDQNNHSEPSRGHATTFRIRRPMPRSPPRVPPRQSSARRCDHQL